MLVNHHYAKDIVVLLSKIYKYIINLFTMDNKLEKIRTFKGNVMDFETYVKSKIDETEKEFKKDRDDAKRKMSKLKESLDFTGEDEPKYCLNKIGPTPADIICYVVTSLRECNLDELVEEFTQKAMNCNYDMLLCTGMEYLGKCNSENNTAVAIETTNEEE